MPLYPVYLRTMNSPNAKPIVFFDGLCSLCNGFVDFLFRYDVSRKFQVASLQGETAEKMLPAHYIEKMDSIILWEDGQIYLRSNAVLKILISLGGAWKLLGILKIIPSPISDVVYKIIAKNRYAWFGKKNSCRLPTASEKSRFLE